MDNAKFVMAGSGDLVHRAVEMAAELGIGQKVLFTGFLRGENVQKIYKMADLFVMPSVTNRYLNYRRRRTGSTFVYTLFFKSEEGCSNNFCVIAVDTNTRKNYVQVRCPP